MRRRLIVLTAVLGVGLALGIIAGPTVRGSIASAQTQPPGPPQSSTPSATLWGQFLDKLASTLNIQRPALDSAITSAGSSTLDTMVQQGRLTQAQADALKARIQAGDL